MKNFAPLFNESPAPMYIYDDRTYEFLTVNDAALHQYGYSRAEFLTMTATQIRPSYEVALFEAVNVEMEDNYFDYGTWTHRRKSGETFFVHIYAYRTMFNGRQARSILAVDIDKRVRTEIAIAEKSAEIINILDSITDGFYALNKNWEITYFNKTAEKTVGRSREELIGKNIWDTFPGLRDGKFYEEYKRAMVTREPVQFEEVYPPLGIWLSLNVYPTNEGIAVYFMDITERKNVQLQILNDKRSLRATINNTTDIIWSVNRQYNIISANDAFWKRVESITGKTRHNVGEADFDAHRLVKWKRYFDKAFQGEAFMVVVEDQYAGRDIFEEVSFNPIRDINDEITGVSCFSRDITAQHLNLKRIEKQNARLREIAWSQSHEVRAPLANIMGLTSTFNFEDYSDPGNAVVIRMICDASQQLETIVRKISDKAQAEWEWE